MLGELMRLLNVTGGNLEDTKLRPRYFVELLELIEAGTLSTGMARDVFEEMFKTGEPPSLIAEEAGMVQISDANAVQLAVEKVITCNPKPVADYLGGKESALRFLVGQVMKFTKGKANPQMAATLVKEKLDSMR